MPGSVDDGRKVNRLSSIRPVPDRRDVFQDSCDRDRKGLEGTLKGSAPMLPNLVGAARHGGPTVRCWASAREQSRGAVVFPIDIHALFTYDGGPRTHDHGSPSRHAARPPLISEVF